MITKPCLNIVEALTGQWGREWGGEGRICNALMAGDHPVATDACGMTLMGHDPHSDWPIPPFRRDRNHLLIAAKHGFGTVDLNEIDFASEVEAPLAEFDSVSTDPDATVANWRRTTCEQGLIYQDEQQKLIDRYRGEFIYMQDGQVVWNGADPSNLGSRRKLSGDKKTVPCGSSTSIQQRGKGSTLSATASVCGWRLNAGGADDSGATRNYT